MDHVWKTYGKLPYVGFWEILAFGRSALALRLTTDCHESSPCPTLLRRAKPIRVGKEFLTITVAISSALDMQPRGRKS